MVNVTVEFKEDDGAAWFEEDTIVINLKWVNIEEEVAWYLDESFMHEYVEHVLGLGHEAAVYVENVLRELLYREWYGVHPLQLLYPEKTSREPLQLERVAPLQSLSQHQDVQAPPV